MGKIKNNSIAAEYYRSVMALPKLKQDEILMLYESEGITKKSIEEEIKEIEEKLGLYKSAEEMLWESLFGIEKTQENEQEDKELLKERLNKLKYLSKNYDQKIYKSTQGYIPHNRKFPSINLRNKIVSGNLYLAISLAYVYFKKSKNNISYDDLVQVAYNSLISAAHYYIPNDKAMFKTYASRCIENALKREIYPRKRKKKIYSKDFFDREKDRVKYIEMFFEALKCEDEYGNVQYNLNIRDSSILFRIDQQIREYNKDKIYREEANRMLKRVLNKKSVKDVLNEYFNIIKNGKLSVLISDEEREIVNLLVNYEGIPQEKQPIYQTFYYFKWYLQKLDAISLYLNAERETIKKNNEITPTDEEILEEINASIKNTNKEIYQLRKNGFFGQGRPSFCEYYDYYNEYLSQYDVDFFNESRAAEKENFAEEYGEYLSYLSDVADDIKQIEAEKVVVYFVSLGGSLDNVPARAKKYIDFSSLSLEEKENLLAFNYGKNNVLNISEEKYYRDQFDEAHYELAELLIMSKQEAEDMIDRYCEAYVNEEDYVKRQLEKRAQVVNAVLAKKNEPIKEKNRLIKKEIDAYDRGKQLKKHWDMRQFLDVKKDINLLYCDDPELILLIDEKQRNNSRSKIMETEEAALQNMFMSDYYEALLELPELERKVLSLYYDKNGQHSKTAKDISQELGISPAKVYQKKNNGLKKLSRNSKMIAYNNVE